MKIIVTIIIICFCGLIGILYKRNLKERIDFYNFIKDYTKYCYNSITIFKNNLTEIISNYLISIKNKNAKFSKLFVNNGKIYQVDKNIIKLYCANENDCDIIYNYITSLSSQNITTIKNNYDVFLKFLDQNIVDYQDKLRVNGEIVFKISLAVGAILSIIIW